MNNTIKILTTFLIIAASSVVRADNELFITQSGDNFVLGAEQSGQNNVVKPLSTASGIVGDDVRIEIHQKHVIDNGLTNVIEYDNIVGNNNTIKLRQGSIEHPTGEVSISSNSSAGHYMLVDVQGNNNAVTAGQTNWKTGTHHAEIQLLSDNNQIKLLQWYEGSKTADITTLNDGNIVELEQRLSGQHTASITLDGAYSSTVNVLQSSTTAQTYSLFQDCQTAGGCSVSIIQE